METVQNLRTEALIGSEGIRKLQQSKVILFGVGGVGSYAGEALVRSGIGTLAIVDQDTVALSNLNRQLIALHSTLEMTKVEAAQQRYKDINENICITPYAVTALPENINDFHLEDYDYVIDAVDMVTAKLAIIETCFKSRIPVISCMGTGNKLHPDRLAVAPIEKTSVCPLARVMRRELKKRGITGIKTVFSRENPELHCTPPGSMAFVPGAAGLLLAAEVVLDLLNNKDRS